MDHNDDHDKDQGLITKIWGPCMWNSMQSVAAYYPENPTPKHKERYKLHFENLGYILPCIHCQKSYRKIIKTGITKLDDKVFESRQTLMEWIYNVHEAVNKKLDVDYGVSFQDFKERYEAYRIPCQHNNKESDTCASVNIDIDAHAFKIASIKECPVISKDISLYFIDYAKQRGISEDEFYMIKYQDNIKENKEIWEKRNQECYDIIQNMRINGKPSIETDEKQISNIKWLGLPTIDELKLIIRFSSNLPTEKLMNIIKKMYQDNPNKPLKNYKIII